MKSKNGIALLAALAIEAVNFFVLIPPIDVGYLPGTAWYIKFVGIQWSILHAAGFFTLSWFERLAGCRQLWVIMACRRVDMVVLFASGYLTTVLLLIPVIFGFQRILRQKAG